jgi:Zn-finger nucleic acid-binding protein
MNASSELVCPACNGSLRAAHATYGVLSCDACGGVWTDAAATEALRTSSAGEITSVAKDVAAHAEGPLPADKPRRRCPVCRHHLRKSTIADVQIDSCSTHGTWFDRGEVEAIYAAAKKPGKTSFGDIAMGVIEVLGAIASGL